MGPGQHTQHLWLESSKQNTRKKFCVGQDWSWWSYDRSYEDRGQGQDQQDRLAEELNQRD